MVSRRTILAGSAALSAAACVSAPKSAAEGPGAGDWGVSSPDAHGLSLTALDKAAAELAAPGERQGLVVIRHGELVYEKYWANAWAKAEPTWKNVSFSAGKSWGSTMAGRAVTTGKLNVDDLASKYAPASATGFKSQVTVKHILTMETSGTMNRKGPSKAPHKLGDPAPPGPGDEYKLYTEAEKSMPPGYAVSIQPGDQFIYDGAAVDHLSEVVAGAVGTPSHRYMMQEIVAPLGCRNFVYQSEGIDHNDNVRIGGSILISCRDMARLGQLYLNQGRWAGRQLIASSYIRDAVAPSLRNPGYGYLWWLNTQSRTKLAPTSMYYAAGARGQFCFVLPEQQLVIATMGFGEKQLSVEDAWIALGPTLPTT